MFSPDPKPAVGGSVCMLRTVLYATQVYLTVACGLVALHTEQSLVSERFTDEDLRKRARKSAATL